MSVYGKCEFRPVFRVFYHLEPRLFGLEFPLVFLRIEFTLIEQRFATDKRARLAVRNNENNLRDGSELLIINMQNTWNAMSDAYKQVEIAMESIGQASKNLRLQTDYYQAGTCTMSDLLEAQALYQQSRDKYVESYAQYGCSPFFAVTIVGRAASPRLQTACG